MESPVSYVLKMPPEFNFLAPVIVDDLIRVGKNNDGGYIIPKSLISETECLVSLGINNDWSFDQHFLSLNPTLAIHAYDHTVSFFTYIKSTISWIIKSFSLKDVYKISAHREIREYAKACFTYHSFFRKKTKHFKQRVCHEEKTNGEACIKSIFARANSQRIFLKSDIEGDEYEIIDDLLLEKDKIVGMIIEFHNIPELREAFIHAIQKLTSVFELAHIHANNNGLCDKNQQLPNVLELTFMKKEKMTGTKKIKRTEFPVSDLDQVNNPLVEHFGMKFHLLPAEEDKIS